METHDLPASWQTINEEDRFEGTALSKRAKKRIDDVRLIGNKRWRVLGNSSLGDSYAYYDVHLPEGETKYDCDCYHTEHGQTRRRKMCSHTLAVVYYRKTEAGSKTRIVDEEPEWHEDTVAEQLEPPEIPDGAVVVRDGPGGGHDAAGWVLDADEPVPVDDPMFTPETLPIPDKFSEFRPHQWKAVVEILEHLEAGTKVVMLSAPTGSGKTLIAETVRRLFAGRSVYSCTTKSLQDQIANDFEYARVIKGRSNYPTQYRADLTAEDCTNDGKGTDCDWCESKLECAYTLAKESAAIAPLPILNIAYFLAETQTFHSKFANRELVIIDEADSLEEQLMGSIEVVMTPRMRESIGVYALPKKTVPEDWAQWLEFEVMPGIVRRRKDLSSTARTLLGIDTKKMKEIKRLDRLREKVRHMLRVDPETGIREIETGWVMTGYEGNKTDSGSTIRFKPVRVSEYANEALWNRGRQFLLMSATLISPQQMADDLGLEDDDWAIVNVKSTFPVENRPVFVESLVSMTNKTKEAAWPVMAEGITDIIDANPGVRILVHTVSYHLTRYLHENIDSMTRSWDSIISYQDARQREDVLRRFLGREDSVLLAPSFERGIDLPEEDCQIIIIAKVPYPYLGDKQISARMRTRGGQTWYAVQTIRSIAQMTGRGMRSKDDWCDTYIMDAQFKRLYRDNKRLFPKWWRDALVLSKTDPKNRSKVLAARERQEARQA